MIINEYPNDTLVTVSVEFRDADGLLTDPDAVSFSVHDPAGTVTDYVFGTDVEVVQDGIGLYHIDLTVDIVGRWHYRWDGDDFAEEAHFNVRPSPF